MIGACAYGNAGFLDPRTALYRLYDAGGVLLYIGVSAHITARWKAHSGSTSWFREVRRQQVTWYPSRAEAMAAETSAIKAERPKWNSKHNPSGPVVLHVPPKRVEHWAPWENAAVGLPPEDRHYWTVDCPFCGREHVHESAERYHTPPCLPDSASGYLISSASRG